MSEPFLAEIRIMGFKGFAPKGWAFCDERHLPIDQNQALHLRLLAGLAQATLCRVVRALRRALTAPRAIGRGTPAGPGDLQRPVLVPDDPEAERLVEPAEPLAPLGPGLIPSPLGTALGGRAPAADYAVSTSTSASPAGRRAARNASPGLLPFRIDPWESLDRYKRPDPAAETGS